MPILGISITPIGTKSASFSSLVTNAVQTIEQKGLKYQVTLQKPLSKVSWRN